MESGTRKLKRKPLSDCTNINPSNRQPSLSTPKLKSNPKSSTIIGSNLPSPRFSPPNFVDAHCEQTPIANTYRQKQPVEKAKGKEKSVAVVPFSCPPAGRTKSIGSKLETQQGETYKRNKKQSGVDLCKTYTIPRQKSKKMPRLSLPKDFVIEQNKYFAEVDAFELEEEVVDESELE